MMRSPIVVFCSETLAAAAPLAVQQCHTVVVALFGLHPDKWVISLPVLGWRCAWGRRNPRASAFVFLARGDSAG